MNSKIILEDIKIFAHHGVLKEEKILGNYFIVNLELHAPLWGAATSDALSDTINYAEVNEIIHQEMKIPSDLLEHVAGRIMYKIQEKYSAISYILIKITKTNPPMKGEMKGVSVVLEKSFENNEIEGL